MMTWQQKRDRIHLRRLRQWRTIYLKGWDAALTGGSCPYTNDEWKGAWQAGFDRCRRGLPLPWWAGEGARFVAQEDEGWEPPTA